MSLKPLAAPVGPISPVEEQPRYEFQAFIGFGAGLWFGAEDLLRHGTLRAILWWKRQVPFVIPPDGSSIRERVSVFDLLRIELPSVGQPFRTKPISSGATVATPMQIGRFDAHFPQNWSEN